MKATATKALDQMDIFNQRNAAITKLHKALSNHYYAMPSLPAEEATKQSRALLALLEEAKAAGHDGSHPFVGTSCEACYLIRCERSSHPSEGKKLMRDVRKWAR